VGAYGEGVTHSRPRATLAVLRASHPGPAVAVTLAATLLALTWGASAGTSVLVGVAALAGQLTVGWSNDLVDRDRDRASHRRDKPLATGEVSPTTVRAAIVVALVVAVVASLSLGVRPGALHLVLVATGWAYNLGLKRTVVSWLPYAVCFGGLPVVVSLAARDESGPGWIVVAGALLGTGAHLVNAVPDLEDDRRTGVVGLPHRLGARRSVDVATVLMLAGTVVTVAVPAEGVDAVGVGALVLVGSLLVVGRLAGGRGPFRAAMGIALVDVVALLLRS
jgi:4-hydroxybenzoate polyprenyltransferase